MSTAWATIIAATIPVLGGLVGLAIKEFRHMRKSNSLDHGIVMHKLDQVQDENNIIIRRLTKVQDSVTHVGDRLNDHIDWHLKK